MNLKTMEIVLELGFFALLGLIIAFLVLFAIKPGSRQWVLFLPLLITALYVPYECYFAIPEVSMGIPIRFDLLVLIPLFECMFIAVTIGWVVSARKYQHRLGYPMAGTMGIFSLAWPIYVATYLMGI